MSRDFTQYDQVTYDEYLRQWREQHDLVTAFFDEDRIERPHDFTPCPASSGAGQRPVPTRATRPQPVACLATGGAAGTGASNAKAASVAPGELAA